MNCYGVKNSKNKITDILTYKLNLKKQNNDI